MTQQALTDDQLWAQAIADPNNGPQMPTQTVTQTTEQPKTDAKPAEPANPQPDAGAQAALSEPDQIAARQERTRTQKLDEIAGRLGGATRMLNAERAKREALEAELAALRAGSTESMPDFAKLKEDAPDWAKGVEQFVEAKLKQVPVVKPEQVNQIIEERIIDRVHKGWKQTINSPEFGEWLPKQPPEIQALAESPIADDAIQLLNSFKKLPDDDNAPSIYEQRQQALRASTTLPTRSSTAPKPPTLESQLTDDELWNQEAGKVFNK